MNSKKESLFGQPIEDKDSVFNKKIDEKKDEKKDDINFKPYAPYYNLSQVILPETTKVEIKNISSGENKTLKFKQAKPLIDGGEWVMVSAK